MRLDVRKQPLGYRFLKNRKDLIYDNNRSLRSARLPIRGAGFLSCPILFGRLRDSEHFAATRAPQYAAKSPDPRMSYRECGAVWFPVYSVRGNRAAKFRGEVDGISIAA
jgi:hypothetical protein